MPAPSLTGTSSGTTETTALSIDVSMTVPADANVILVGFGGFAGAVLPVISVQGDPTGTPYDLNDLELYVQNGTDQYAGLYAIYDTNVNWPGSGAVTVRVTIDTGGRQLKAGIGCLTDVDTAGTPLNDSGTATGGSGNPSVTLTSSSNAYSVGVAGTYSGDIGDGDDTLIYEQQNSTSSSSLYMWGESGTGASDTIEGSGASVAFAMVAASFEGTGGSPPTSTPKNIFYGPFAGPFRGPL